MKARILEILRREYDFHSGETLSRELGVSRVTVWKHIKALQESGYHIEAGGKGYRLTGSPDVPYPWEFPRREKLMHYHPELESTMGAARQMAREGCPAFTTVVAGRQTRGRGRMARSWQSEPGGLYFTLVLRPKLPVVDSPKVCFAAALALTETLREDVGVEAAVKWPNDILAGKRKLAGMLSEMEADGDLVSFVNIGIGINVNNDPAPAEPGAVSLCRLLGHDVSPVSILSAFLDRLESRLDPPSLDRAITDWKVFTTTLNRKVCVQTLQEEVCGMAVDVDENGALMVRTANQELKRVVFGDCFHKGE